MPVLLPPVDHNPAAAALDEVVSVLQAATALTADPPAGWGATVYRVHTAGSVRAKRLPEIAVSLIRENRNIQLSQENENELEISVVALWHDGRNVVDAGDGAGEQVVQAILQALYGASWTKIDPGIQFDAGIIPGEAFLGEEAGAGTVAVQANLRAAYLQNRTTGAKS